MTGVVDQPIWKWKKINEEWSNERENWKIAEMVRTLKYLKNPEINFPDAIWAELVSSAIYILNGMGKSSVEGVSPY